MEDNKVDKDVVIDCKDMTFIPLSELPKEEREILKKQREGRMYRENSKIIDIVKNKNQVMESILKDIKKQKKNKNRDIR